MVLKGKQKKLDKNKDGKITKSDFKLLRGRKRKKTIKRKNNKKKSKPNTTRKTKRKSTKMKMKKRSYGY